MGTLATGSHSTVGSTLVVNAAREATITFTLIGTPVGASIVFEGTSDGQTWAAVQAASGPAQTLSSTATSAGDYSVAVAGSTQIRTRLTAITSGAFSVAVTAVPTTTSTSTAALPIASATVLGGVKQGANVTIDAGGTISATASGAPTGTLRNIATRCRHDLQYYTGTNLTTCAGRSAHVNMGSGVYGPQIVLGNWIANNTGEIVPTGGAITETVSIEYPAGEYTMASWDAANASATRTESISIPAGGADVVSDPVPVFIPQGATFWVRRISAFTSGSAAEFPVSMSAVATGSDTTFVGWTGAVTGNDLRSYLTGTAISGSTTALAQMRYPLAILGISSVASALILGDSRCAGYNDSGVVTIAGNPGPNGAADWGRWGFGEIARSIGHARPYANLGCPTDAAYGYVANSSSGFRSRQQTYHTDVIVQYGVNDVNLAGRTAAATQTALSTIYGYFPTKRVWQSTISPVSASTDSWATVANQTTAGSNAQRVLLNTWIRTAPAPLTGIFDNAAVVETSLNSGIWNVVAGLGAPTGDGLHFTPAYYKLIDTSKSVDPSRLTTI